MTKAVSTNLGQPFLLSKSRAGCPRNGNLPIEDLPQLPAGDPIRNEFEDIPSGIEFVTRGSALVEDAAIFSTLVLRLDAAVGQQQTLSPEKLLDYRCKAAQSIAQVAEDTDAFWGFLTAETFGCILPGRDQASGVAVAKKIQTALAAIDGHTLTVGIAAYPCLRYTAVDVIQNAVKALDHASFYGPGSRSCFDGVSLNISGDCYYDAGEIENAIAEYRNALRLDPRNINVLNSLGVCFGVRGDYDKALTAFNAAAKIDPKEVLALYNAGLIHLLRENRQTALEIWLKAAPRGPDIFELNIQIGRCLLEAGQPDKAQGYIHRAVSSRPESAQAQRLLGDIFLAQRLTDQAIAPYKTALRVNPNNAAALSGLARCYELRGENMEIALSFCRQSVEIAPDNGRAFMRLGRLLVKANRLEEARQAFKTAETLGEDARDMIASIDERLVEKAS
jgi:tetratricopeptide (TPR) repeat protein